MSRAVGRAVGRAGGMAGQEASKDRAVSRAVSRAVGRRCCSEGIVGFGRAGQWSAQQGPASLPCCCCKACGSHLAVHGSGSLLRCCCGGKQVELVRVERAEVTQRDRG